MIDKPFLSSIFAGDNTAFTKLYKECRELFMAYFAKHFPGTKVSIQDLYQDSITEFWSQIIDGKLTEESLRCSVSTYVVSIGINKMREGYRGVQKADKIAEALKQHPSAFRISGGAKTPILDIEDREKAEKENIRLRLAFLKKKYEELGYPCTLLLRYTWYNNMTDDKILEAFGGYFANTNSLKSKRFKCRKTLDNMYQAWKKTIE